MDIIDSVIRCKRNLAIVLVSGLCLALPFDYRLAPITITLSITVWILYSMLISKNIGLYETLKKDSIAFIPFVILALSIPILHGLSVKSLYPGVTPSQDHIKRTFILLYLLIAISLFASLKVFVHRHFENISVNSKVFYAVFLVHVIIYPILVYMRFNALNYYGSDISAYIQRIWYIANTGIPKSTVFYVPVGGDPIVFDVSRWLPLYITAPFYMLTKHPSSILIVHTIFTAIAVIPIYLMAKDLLGKFPAFLIATSFLFHPAIQYRLLSDFHNDAFGMAFLSIALYAMLKRRDKLFVMSAILMILCKENFFLVGIMLGLFALIKFKNKIGIFLILFSIIWTYLTFFVFTLSGGSEFFMTRYSYLGNTTSEALRTIIFNPIYVLKHVFTLSKVVYLITLLLPIAFLSLFSSLITISLPIFVQNLLSERYYMYSITFQYCAILLPILYFAMIDFLSKVKNKDIKRFNRILNRIFGVNINTNADNLVVSLSVLVFLLTLSSSAAYGPFGYIYKTNVSSGHCVYFENFLIETPDDRTAKEIAKLIPNDDSVIVNEPFQLLLSERERIYTFHHYTFSKEYVSDITSDKVDYIVFNLNNPRLKNCDGWREWINGLEGNGWIKVIERDGIVVLKSGLR